LTERSFDITLYIRGGTRRRLLLPGPPETMETRKKGKSVPTQIKNQDLVVRRRRQIIDAAVRLFIEKGFHKTTTRQIAAAAGLPIGSMYEYVASKEDILYLVCDAIHAEVEKGVIEAMARASKGKNILANALREYLLVCDRMSDHILLIYQETQSLPRQWRRKVLENEVRITGIFITLIKLLISSGDLPARGDSAVEVAAHNIAVMGHMWTFRRWFFARHYSIEEYIKLQTEFILGMYTMKAKK
jgi:TetR/AcrR family transcriptional regulator, cholesterol catabolism regulator